MKKAKVEIEEVAVTEDTDETEDAMDHIRPKLRRVIPNVSGCLAACPAHADSGSALVVSGGFMKPVNLRCQNGCSQEAIMKKLGLKEKDLGAYEDPEFVPQPPHYGCDIDYKDERGRTVFRVCRTNSTDFWQGRLDDGGGWIQWLTDEHRWFLFNLRAVLAAGSDEAIFLLGSEPEVQDVTDEGLIATTYPKGVWRKEYAKFLRGKRVFIILPNDRKGKRHAAKIAASLRGIAAEAVVVELPKMGPGDSVSDWLNAGGTGEELWRATMKCPPRADDDSSALAA